MRHRRIIRLIASLARGLGGRAAPAGEEPLPIAPELLPLDLAALGPTSLLHDM